MMGMFTENRFKPRRWLSAATILTLAACNISLAQTTPGALPASPQGQSAETEAHQSAYTLSVRTQLVTLDVVVNDKKGEPIQGLTRNDFTIYEDQVTQPIVSFEATEPKPVTGRRTIPIHS